MANTDRFGYLDEDVFGGGHRQRGLSLHHGISDRDEDGLEGVRAPPDRFVPNRSIALFLTHIASMLGRSIKAGH